MNKLHTWKSLRLTTLLCSIFMVSLQLVADKANAQVAHYTATNGTGTTVTVAANVSVISHLTPVGLGSLTPCSSGGLSGLTNNGVTTFNTANGRVYFDIQPTGCYQINITSFTAKLRRSGSGIQKVRMAYSLNGGTTWVNDNVDKAPDNTSCGNGATVHSWNVAGGGSLPTVPAGGHIIIALYPYAPVSSGGVVQINDITIGGSVVLGGGACTGTPSHATISSAQTVCVGTTVNALTASGFAATCGITYQWQSDASGSYADISGATNTNYAPSAPATAGTVNYRMITNCSGGGSDTSNVISITANSNPSVSVITPADSVICVKDSITLNATTDPGTFNVWSVVAGGTFVDAFTVPAVFAPSVTGTTQVTLTSTNLSTGCITTRTVNVSAMYCDGPCRLDLALYQGTGGTSTNVLAANNATASAIAAHGSFGTAAPCGSGGLSGLNNFTAASFSTANPYISYVVTANNGKVVNAYQAWIKTRSSGTGPTKGRLAYRYNMGAGWSGWIAEGADHTLSTSGSCGSNTNVWSWTMDSAISSPSGAKQIEIGFWPFAAGAAGGTIQVNQLELIGCVGDSVVCSSPAHATITPGLTRICDDGFYKTQSFAGATGLVGLSYQWQVSNTGAPGSFTNIGLNDSIGENNIYYTSKVQGDSMYYRLVTTCAFGGSDTSNVDTLAIIPHPGSISISGLSGAGYVAMGSSVTVTGATGGLWDADHFSIANFTDSTVNPATLNGLLKGFTTFVNFFPNTIGCTVTDSVKVAAANSLTAYTGKQGTSVAVENPFSVSGFTYSDVYTGGTGFNAPGAPCAQGGISGLTINTTVATYTTSGPRVCYTVRPTAGNALNLTGFDATTRSSAQGASMVTLAYSLDGGTNWVDNGGAAAENTFGCGISTVDQVFSFSSNVIVYDSIMVCVFPYAPGNGSGTFQVNALDVEGTVCPIPTAILDLNSTSPLNGEGYNFSCADGISTFISLSSTPGGGTWSSSSAFVTIDPATGDMGFSDPGTDIPVTITYTSTCGAAATATFTLSSTGFTGCTGHSKPGAHSAAVAVTNVDIYPNPTTGILNIVSAEKVNVTILSMDGRTLIKKDGVSSVNVSSLASGAYMIQIYSNNSLIKTAKFTKE